MNEVAFGIDIGGTYTKIGIADKKGKVFGESTIFTQEGHDTVHAFIDTLKDKMNFLLSNVKEKISVKGIGIGAPNGNFYKGTIEDPPNLKWKGVIDMIELLRAHFDYPIMLLTNDANAAALGEMIYGGAKNMRNFVVITLGTGLGSGLVVNGELVYGHDGFAGELGHTTIKCGGRMCGTGKRGCLEAYVSATGIVRTVYELLADSLEESVFRDIPFNKLESKRIHEEALKNDPIALKAFEYTGKLLGKALADTVAHLSPEAIFLFGGLAKAGDLIFVPTKRSLEESVLPIFANKIKILPSELNSGANAAVLGAAALVWKELETEN